ncbi:glycoside hydrolase family 51 protein [Crucibulum laeve]|uniref:non-reducing end alpha-L-arabinofuranosidase n=1 Tax=Crucibulum laeve TaxID=68775 RepID=A0A5C3LTG2_9AGAR|nr:glycoside hydrolase family 51 protein [Crucibulum laeve]
MLISFSSALALLLTIAEECNAVTVSVSATASHAIPTTLCKYYGDGGLYAELLQNRAFQQVTPGTAAALNAWRAINSNITVVKETTPVSAALPNALQLAVPSTNTGRGGFANSGYFGIKVTEGATYTASFFYRFPASSSFSGNATIGLETASGQVVGSTVTVLSGSNTGWTQVNVTFQPEITPIDTNNLFTVTLDGAEASGQVINFALLSLFPPTFKNRPNGMRVDIATALAEMAPTFFRLPGGNNLEGETIATRWQWNATVGPLVDRPGRVGDWSYVNTDGLGLLEYLNWCEDLNMQPILAVWGGFSLDKTSVAEGQLERYIQQAIEQINFVIGDPAKNEQGALRASLGHPEPFALTYVEIGNEDFLGPSTYTYRWKDFATALKMEFPDLHFIATTRPFNPILSPNPTEYDVHVYQTPTWFRQNSFIYDGFQRNGTKYFEGEYAAISTNSSNLFGTPATGRLTFPTMQSAAGEAAFITGLERNSDIVFAASYAPLLGHASNNQWMPNLVSFDAGFVYKSTSYYVQKMFGVNAGDEYLPSTLPTPSGTLFWSVVRKTSSNKIIIKVLNSATTSAVLTFVLSFENVENMGSVEVISGAATASNTPTTPELVTPITSSITVGQTFNYTAPAMSVSVLIFTAQ